MTSRSTLQRQSRGNRINSIGVLAMVSCKYCAKKGWECKLSSLSKQCGNCVHNGIVKCEPIDLPAPNFARIDSEMSRLEALEEQAEEAEEAAAAALNAARSKLSRLRKQKKLLKRREQSLFDKSEQYEKDLAVLEALETLGQDVGILDDGLMPGSLALDWSAFTPADLDLGDVSSVSIPEGTSS